MAEITEDFARQMLRNCEDNNHPALTIHEAKQLAWAWLQRDAAKKLEEKLIDDTGYGCSVCRGRPVVNVSGTYWLCGPCVAERLPDDHTEMLVREIIAWLEVTEQNYDLYNGTAVDAWPRDWLARARKAIEALEGR